MKSRFIKVVLLLTARFVFFFGPSVAYNYMDPRSEFSPIADQLRQLSVYHEHNHASFSNAEHRRHYEAFDFDIPYQALKPKVQAMFTGPGWKREEGAEFI